MRFASLECYDCPFAKVDYEYYHPAMKPVWIITGCSKKDNGDECVDFGGGENEEENIPEGTL